MRVTSLPPKFSRRPSGSTSRGRNDRAKFPQSMEVEVCPEFLLTRPGELAVSCRKMCFFRCRGERHRCPKVAHAQLVGGEKTGPKGVDFLSFADSPRIA